MQLSSSGCRRGSALQHGLGLACAKGWICLVALQDFQISGCPVRAAAQTNILVPFFAEIDFHLWPKEDKWGHLQCGDLNSTPDPWLEEYQKGQGKVPHLVVEI